MAGLLALPARRRLELYPRREPDGLAATAVAMPEVAENAGRAAAVDQEVQRPVGAMSNTVRMKAQATPGTVCL
ncbi:hypothetical protein [Reyranella sp.]|uniref:hypothetical protein n=1 Tax=Reyranella sp. TaxID=1929291 RepID=UPI003D0DDC9B